MRDARPRRCRVILGIALLALAACGPYSIRAARAQTSQPGSTFPNLDSGRVTTSADTVRKAQSMALLLLISSLLFLVFVIATYFLLRRRLEERPEKKPTKYVDAWSNYRLSDASIRAATAEEPRAAPPRPAHEDDDERIWDDDDPDRPPEKPA